MISNILVPTDFSDVANNALHFAIKLSEKTGAKLHVLHVTYVPIIDASFPADVYQTFMAEIEETAKRNFGKLKQTHLENSGVKYETNIVSHFAFNCQFLFDFFE